MNTLSMYTIGKVVYSDGTTRPDGIEDIGHVMGFTRNNLDEVVLIIKFSRYYDPCHVHPANIQLLGR